MKVNRCIKLIQTELRLWFIQVRKKSISSGVQWSINPGTQHLPASFLHVVNVNNI